MIDRTVASARDIEALLFRFSHAVDNRRSEQVAACFTDDAVFRPNDREMRGRATIARFYADRLADPCRTTRHIWANMEIQRSNEEEATLRATLTNYAVEPEISLSHLQMRIGDVACRCVRDSRGDWFFAEHFYTRLFTATLPLLLPPARSGEPTS